MKIARDFVAASKGLIVGLTAGACFAIAISLQPYLGWWSMLVVAVVSAIAAIAVVFGITD